MKKILKLIFTWLYENLMFNIFISVLAMVGTAGVVKIIRAAQQDKIMDQVISEVKATEAGKFAVHFLERCHEGNLIGRSDLECAKEVTDGAKALQGEAFSKEVGAALSKIIEAR